MVVHQLSFERKRRAAHALMVALTVWPLIHHVIVRVFDLNPWKLFGWSMYCVPQTYVTIRLFDLSGDEVREIGYERELPRLVGKIHEYRDRRWAYGKLLPPTGLAADIFRARADLQRLRVVVELLGLDRRTAYYQVAEHSYDYRRSELVRDR